jgi:PKD repeat protein
MPIETDLLKPVEADWSFQIVDMDRRLVAFKDESVGPITSWKWEFGDGKTSSEQHPTHQYEKAGEYIVVLYIDGPKGKSRRAKVWDVTLR